MNIRKHLQGPMTDEEFEKCCLDLKTMLFTLAVCAVIAGVCSWFN